MGLTREGSTQGSNSWRLGIPHDYHPYFSATSVHFDADARTAPVGLTWRAASVGRHLCAEFNPSLSFRQVADERLHFGNIAETGRETP
jgi:hypothetical protein